MSDVICPCCGYRIARSIFDTPVDARIAASTGIPLSDFKREPCDGCNPPAPNGKGLCNDCLERANG